MKPQHPKRTKWLTIRMTPEEYQQLEALARQTVPPSVSDYGRRVLLGKPVVKRFRNQSLDDFLADMLQLRHELNHIGTNFNQAVHRLHGLHKLPEIQQWILHNEQDKTQLFRQIETISQKVNDAYILWSRE
jgi:hypothetical protein